MKTQGLALLALALMAGLAVPQQARADVGFSVSVNDGGRYGHGYGGYRGGYHDWRRGNYYYPSYGVYPAYPPYSPPVIYAPPPVVYTQPPVIYTPPQRSTVIVTQPPVYSEPTIPANQASPTYTNESGQTCREYQSTVTVGGVQQPSYGTACLQPDGSWRVVQ